MITQKLLQLDTLIKVNRKFLALLFNNSHLLFNNSFWQKRSVFSKSKTTFPNFHQGTDELRKQDTGNQENIRDFGYTNSPYGRKAVESVELVTKEF